MINETSQQIEESGCPFRKVYGTAYCQLSPWGMQEVEGFLMCEVDWESCPDYKKRKALEARDK